MVKGRGYYDFCPNLSENEGVDGFRTRTNKQTDRQKDGQTDKQTN